MSIVRRLRRTFGISAERVAVRTDLPWYWRLALLTLFVVAVALGGFVLLGRDTRRAENVREFVRMQGDLERQAAELAELRSRVAGAERQMQMERAAAGDLAKQVKALTFENAKLKEDLAFFESLMSSSGTRQPAINVSRFKLRAEPAGDYRYQLLLVQTGQRVGEFHGTLQFVLDVQQDGRKLALVLPQQGERENRDYRLSFKFFQRVEGTFRLKPGSVLKGMQVRVFENGATTPKLTQALNIS